MCWQQFHHLGRPGDAANIVIAMRFDHDQILGQSLIEGAGGQQIGFQTAIEPLQACGHIDGIIEGLVESKQPHLFECKSSSEKRFNDLKKVGYEKWDEKYRAQIHVYMLLLKLKRCLVWVENKNTSEVYTERISVDNEYAVVLLERVFNAIKGTIPERSCPNSSWYEAKWCGYYNECFSIASINS